MRHPSAAATAPNPQRSQIGRRIDEGGHDDSASTPLDRGSANRRRGGADDEPDHHCTRRGGPRSPQPWSHPYRGGVRCHALRNEGLGDKRIGRRGDTRRPIVGQLRVGVPVQRDAGHLVVPGSAEILTTNPTTAPERAPRRAVVVTESDRSLLAGCRAWLRESRRRCASRDHCRISLILPVRKSLTRPCAALFQRLARRPWLPDRLRRAS
jgi:hypothetical protein